MKEQISTESWPVVVIQMESEVSVESMQLLLDSWESWLDRKEPFGMLFRFEGTENNHSGEIKKMRKAWIKAHRGQVRQTMAGVAMVVKSSAILNLLKPIADTVARQMFGCKAKVFGWESDRQAMEWLQSQIEATGNQRPV